MRSSIGSLGLAGHLLLAVLAPAPLAAEPRHGLSIFGDLKYPANFKHFDYVNPDAPKGGRLVTVGANTFDSFNMFILRGDPASGLSLLYDTLMVSSGDEASTMYGLVAETADLAADRMSIIFKLRASARFADGTPVTADDVVFSFETLKEKGQPAYRFMLRDVVKGEAIDRLTVRFTFEGEQVRDLPLAVAGLPVLPKSYYQTHPFEETTLKPPLGSGPYVISDFKQGSFVSYKRREDYWAKDLPVNRGRWNFDEIRFVSYRDRPAELEDIKSGNLDLREEFTAKDWVTAYDIPAVKEGRLKRITLPDNSPSGAQGFFLNTRREKFADVRVRRAMDLAFDYQWMNKNLFYELYTRTESYFENSDMKATGKPGPEELALLEPFRDRLPKEVFEEPYRPPVSDGSGSDRRLLREAQRLLQEAGWRIDPAKPAERLVRNARGETLDVEFLINQPTFERIIAPYIKNLEAIGIRGSIRRVDSAQYERRVKAFDFDVVAARFVMSLTPGIELRNYWGSEAAASEGSRNYAGIKDPVIDALLDRMVQSKSRQELVVATRAMDRVLRAGHYWVPHWFKASHHIAYWDKFGRPDIKPKYDRGVTDTWWHDAAKAATLRVR